MQGERGTLQVLIADRSKYARLQLEGIVGSEEDLSVTALAGSTSEMLELLQAVKADVVLLDHGLPGNNNLLALKRIFTEAPVPVALLVQASQVSLTLLKEAVELGVYAIICKPGQGHYTTYRSIASEVLCKVRAVQGLWQHSMQRRLQELQQELVMHPYALSTRQQTGSKENAIIVLGGSTGGTLAVETILKQLKPDLQATILVVLHLPQAFTKTFVKRLQQVTSLKVTEGRKGTVLKPGTVIVAPGNRNMVVESIMGNPANLRVGFSQEATTLFDQPSIDLLMRSVAKSDVKKLIGVILTGLGEDGTLGASYFKNRGGYMIAQDEATSIVFGMARSAIQRGNINKVLPLQQIPLFLNKLLAEQQVSATDNDYEIERTGV